MTANKNLLRMKFSKVISAYAKRTGRSFDESVARFYGSKTYELMRDGISDLHCMSVPYLVQDLIDDEVAESQAVR